MRVWLWAGLILVGCFSESSSSRDEATGLGEKVTVPEVVASAVESGTSGSDSGAPHALESKRDRGGVTVQRALVGLETQDIDVALLEARLGQPTLVRKEHGRTLIQYHIGGCIFDILLRGKRLEHWNARGLNGRGCELRS